MSRLLEWTQWTIKYNFQCINCINLEENYTLSDDSSITISELDFCQFTFLNQYHSIRNTNDRLLDLILANFICSVLYPPVCFVPEDSHHSPLHVQFEVTLTSLHHNQNTISKFFNLKNADLYSLYQLIIEFDWLFVKDFNNVDLALEAFCINIYTLLVQFDPTVQISNR